MDRIRDLFHGQSDLTANASEDQIRNAQAGLGLFSTAQLYTADDFLDDYTNKSVLNYAAQINAQIDDTARTAERMMADRKADLLAAVQAKKDAQMQDLQSGSKYRKAELLRNPDGTLQEENEISLRAKLGANWLADKWNAVNDIVPFVDKDTLDIEGRFTGTIAGMQNENLQNKNLFSGKTKADVAKEISQLKDDPNGTGTIYQLRRQDGFNSDGTPKYLYKVGFSTDGVGQRFAGQIIDGWELVGEKRSSGAEQLEKDLHTAFIGDRALSYDQVQKDGKWMSRDKASGINFGAGYGEIYNKDILGWDKKSTGQDLADYKAAAIKSGQASKLSGSEMSELRGNLDKLTVDDLDSLKKTIALDRAREESTSTASRKSTRDDDISTYAKAGLTSIYRQTLDATLDAIAVKGMDRNSSWLGQILEADGRGNSELLDQWKTQDQVDKDVGFDRTENTRWQNKLKYDYDKGDYVGVLSGLLTKEALGTTVESVAYLAPMIGTAIIAEVFTGGAATGLIGVRAAEAARKASQLATSIKTGRTAEGAIMSAEEIALAGKNLQMLHAEVAASGSNIANKLSSVMNHAKSAGMFVQNSAMANERIDERIKNNGGVDTGLLENVAIFAGTYLENSIDRFVNLSLLGTSGHKAVQNAYKLLDDTAKGNVYAKLATKAVALIGSAGIEGATEFVQGWMENFIEQYDTKKNGGTIEGILSSAENKEEALLNFMMGVAGGAHFQAVPTGINLAGDAVGSLGRKITGAEKLDKQTEKARTISSQILKGELDPYSSPVSYSGNLVDHAVHDAMYAVSSRDQGMIGSFIGASALNTADVNSKDPTLPLPDGTRVDLQTAVDNLDSSLKRMYKIGSGVETDQQKAYYSAGLVQSAQNGIAQVIQYKNELDSADSVTGLSDETQEKVVNAMNHIFNAYKGKLVEADLNYLVMYASNALLEDISSKASSGTAKSNADAIMEKTHNFDTSDTEAMSVVAGLVSKNGRGISTEISIDKVRAAVDMLNGLNHGASTIMGSGPSQSSGGSNKQSGFSTASTLQHIAKIEKELRAKIDFAEAQGLKDIQFEPQFFDQLKTTAGVGTEILFTGKIDNEKGKKYGKGIYQHLNDILKEINKQTSGIAGKVRFDKGASGLPKLDDKAIGSFYRFAIGRAKIRPNSVSESQEDGLFEARDVFGKEENSYKYAHNYIPEMDFSGSIARTKIAEAQHILNAANLIKQALASSYGKIDTEQFNDYSAKISEVIARQQSDISALQKYTKGIEKNKETGSVRRLVELRSAKRFYEKKLKELESEPESSFNLRKIEDTKQTLEQIEELLDRAGKKYSGSTKPVYGFIEHGFASSRENDFSPVETIDENHIDKDFTPSDDYADEDEVDVDVAESDSVSSEKEQEKEEEKKDEQDSDSAEETGKTEEASTDGADSVSSERAIDEIAEIKSSEEVDLSSIVIESDGRARDTKTGKFVSLDDLLEESETKIQNVAEEIRLLISDLAERYGVSFNSLSGSTFREQIKSLKKIVMDYVRSHKKEQLDQKGIFSELSILDKLADLYSARFSNLGLASKEIASDLSIKNQPEFVEKEKNLARIEKLLNGLKAGLLSKKTSAIKRYANALAKELGYESVLFKQGEAPKQKKAKYDNESESTADQENPFSEELKIDSYETLNESDIEEIDRLFNEASAMLTEDQNIDNDSKESDSSSIETEESKEAEEANNGTESEVSPLEPQKKDETPVVNLFSEENGSAQTKYKENMESIKQGFKKLYDAEFDNMADSSLAEVAYKKLYDAGVVKAYEQGKTDIMSKVIGLFKPCFK